MSRLSEARELAYEHAIMAEACSNTLLKVQAGQLSPSEVATTGEAARERFPREVMLAAMWAAVADVMRP